MATAVSVPSSQDTDALLAARYAGDLVYKALIAGGDPLKTSEVVKAIDRPDFDVKLVRVVLATNTATMTAAERKLTLWSRYLTTRNTLDNNLHRILGTFGQPILLTNLAKELEHIYGRPEEVFVEMLTQIVARKDRFFAFGDGYVAPTAWLLTTPENADEEVLFENFLADDDVFPYEAAAKKAGFDPEDIATVTAFLEAVGKPVKNKALQFFGWRTNRNHFDAARFYADLFLQSGATPLSDGTWISASLAQKLAAHFPAIAEQEVSDTIEETPEVAQPLTLGDNEREQLIEAVLDQDESVHAVELLEDIFEVTPDESTYEADLQTVLDALKTDERVLWVGGDRFRQPGTIPGYVYSVPGLLEIPTYSFTDVEGNPVDQLLSDDGLDGGLEREILSPLAQDVLDEELVGRPDPNPPSNARVVIKYHHKQIGTLPLCQFTSGFFPPTPGILEAQFLLPGGQKAQVWINNETRLLYGLLDWFQSIPIDSGATFTLERQAPDRYIVNFNDETEPSMFISRNRINELLELQERAEREELSTYDVLREIMEHYRKGIEFLTLLTEVNIVRRVTRRLVASLLTEYHCFFQRGGAWVYDPKKLTQGFDKSKRKYLLK